MVLSRIEIYDYEFFAIKLTDTRMEGFSRILTLLIVRETIFNVVVITL